MQQQAIRKVIQGNIEAMDQGICLVQNLSDDQYTSVPTDYVSSSIGQHFRHILDLYQAVLQPTRFCAIRAQQTPLLDYDHRRRGADIETCRQTAIDEMRTIKRELKRRASEPDQAVSIRTEVCLDKARPIALDSTLARELAFASCHATHHYALAAVIAKLQGVQPDASIGLAPATASHLRHSACSDTAAG
jgi:uncharacterized damage-inducible protein DinB